MGKNRKKGSKKRPPSHELLATATSSLQQFRRFSRQVGKLSTAQKVVGGLFLLAAGYAYRGLLPLGAARATPAPGPQQVEPPQEGNAPANPPQLRKPRRGAARPSHQPPFSLENL